MPGIDGLEADCAITRSRPVPIVAITAHDQPEFLERAIRCGVAAYLVKPVDGRQVERALRLTVSGIKSGNQIGAIFLAGYSARPRMVIQDQHDVTSVTTAGPLSDQLVRRIAAITPFPVVDVMEAAWAAERAGRSIVHLEVGEPDAKANRSAGRGRSYRLPADGRGGR